MRPICTGRQINPQFSLRRIVVCTVVPLLVRPIRLARASGDPAAPDGRPAWDTLQPSGKPGSGATRRRGLAMQRSS
jgi:hypothetical protein